MWLFDSCCSLSRVPVLLHHQIFLLRVFRAYLFTSQYLPACFQILRWQRAWLKMNVNPNITRWIARVRCIHLVCNARNEWAWRLVSYHSVLMSVCGCVRSIPLLDHPRISWSKIMFWSSDKCIQLFCSSVLTFQAGFCTRLGLSQFANTFVSLSHFDRTLILVPNPDLSVGPIAGSAATAICARKLTSWF